MPQAPKVMPQRPWHDPQQVYDGGQQKVSQMPQRPQFDPQHSHDAGNRPYQWHDHGQRPTIPVPQFTSFNVESALPPPEPQPESLLSPQKPLPQSASMTQTNDLNRYRTSESVYKTSILPVGRNDADHWVSTSKSWEPQAAFVSSSEQQHAVLPDGQSISTTDLSINTAAVSTPGSYQNSNKSYRENENREDRGRSERQGDDSFYWHSGRSSSDAGEDQGLGGSPTATPGNDSVGPRSSMVTSMGLQHEHQDLPTRPTSLSQTTPATYGASVLGFGGPSDWEYFGDYEAEEIDDEDLYSRPRPRESRIAVEGSTELPVNPPFDSIKLHSKLNQPDSNLMRLEITPLREIVPAGPLRKKSLEENVVQELRVSGEGDYETDAKPLSALGPDISRAVPDQAASLPNTHGQQRLDLDDIIRAWSQAPYVGKVHEAAPPTGYLPDNDEEAANIAEASLASTPRERMLGVDVIIKGAPSLIKLPDSTDSVNFDKRELQRDVKVSATPSNAVLTATSPEEQMQPLSKQPESTTNEILAIAAVKPKKGESHISKRVKTSQNALPVVGTVVSSSFPLSIPTEQSISRTSLNEVPSRDTYTHTGTHGLREASRETTQTGSDEESHVSPLRNNLDPDKQILQDKKVGKLKSENREDCKRNSLEIETEVSQKSGGIRSSEGIVVSSETLDNLFRGKPTSKQLIVSRKTMRDRHLFVHGNASQVNVDAGDSMKPRLDHSRDHIKTPNTQGTGDKIPLKGSVTDAPPPLASGASLHHTGSSEMDTVQDPYSDLDPWGKASLNRFAAMLREESRAETNQEKLNIFHVFTSRESRLRVVLYGTDDELIILQEPQQEKPEKGEFVEQAAERANSIGLRRSLKALPALPANRESVTGLPGNALAPLVVQHGSTSQGRGIDLVWPTGDDFRSKQGSEMSSESHGDDSYVMVDSPFDKVQYSPGGTPVVARLLKTGRGIDVESPHDAASAFEKDSAASLKTSERVKRADLSGSEGPVAVQHEDFEAPKTPAYTPLKYSDGRSEVKNYLANRKSVYRPYATLTQGSLETVSTFGREEDINLAGAGTIIMAPASQCNPIAKVTIDGAVETATTNEQRFPGAEGSTELRRFVRADFDPLLLTLPKSDAALHESVRLLELRNVIEVVPDDFSFIHQCVVAWDAKARKQREENDRQRHTRQAESEQKIDSLFDDHEIGYGDIGELELEFKRAEAARRADEDRFEYKTFVSDVFNIVWTRLHYELDQLAPHYGQYSKLMDQTLAGKDTFEGSEEGLPLGPTMSSFLALHQKLEIRHQKAFEAVLERDRRLKKTEISPWYTLSDIAKVKQLEKQFEDAEKKAIIEYCQQRDARANHLMDVLDQNTLRGVGANQDYMEAIMKAVRRTPSGRAFASVPGSNEPTAGLEEVVRAKAITALLASSSEQIVQTFHVADMLLNSADYEVSVAKAKVAKADMATLAKLKEERAKEDQKLMRALEHRLALIREDSRRTNDEIVKLMLFLGIQNGRTDKAPAHAEPADAQHEARNKRDLEEAKRRNVLKES